MKVMERALDEYYISGLVNNIPFCRSVFRNKAFRHGKYGTSFIGQQYPKGFHGVVLTAHETLQLVTVAAHLYRANHSIRVQSRDPHVAWQQQANGGYDESEGDLIVVLSDNNNAVNPPLTKYLVKTDYPESGFVASIQAFSGGNNSAPAHIDHIELAGWSWASPSLLGVATFSKVKASGSEAASLASSLAEDAEPETEEVVVQVEQQHTAGVAARGGAGEVLLIRFAGSQVRVEIRYMSL